MERRIVRPYWPSAISRAPPELGHGVGDAPHADGHYHAGIRQAQPEQAEQEPAVPEAGRQEAVPILLVDDQGVPGTGA